MEEGDLFRARVRKGAIDEKNQADEKKKKTREKVTFKKSKKRKEWYLDGCSQKRLLDTFYASASQYKVTCPYIYLDASVNLPLFYPELAYLSLLN